MADKGGGTAANFCTEDDVGGQLCVILAQLCSIEIKMPDSTVLRHS